MPTEPGWRVPFFNQAATFEGLWPLIRSHLTSVIDHGKYSHGAKVAELEAALRGFTGARHVVGVNSGTDALLLLLRACGLEPGDEVVVPAYSFIASASAVVLAGARPAFADIDPVTYALDASSAAQAITPRTRMLMPVHLFAQMADMDSLLDLAVRNGLAIVEDSAEAIGMRWNGIHAGLLGTGGVLSFFPTKTLGAIGDAGAIITDDRGVADTAAALRHHGRFGPTLDNFSLISTPTSLAGINSKMDDFQAAVLLAKLLFLERDIARRRLLAEAYGEALAGTPGILRLPAIVPRKAQTNPVFYVYLMEVERRDELAAYLARCGVETEIYYPRPLHLQPCFADLGYGRGDFPHAEMAAQRAIALPLYPDMSLDDVELVSDRVHSFYVGARALLPLGSLGRRQA